MKNVNHKNNPLGDGIYLTDGGLETTLVFHEGIELNHFAAFELMTHSEGRRQLVNYLQPYLQLANHHQLNFVVETPTWRANRDWGFKLGYNEQELLQINRQAVQFFAEKIKSAAGQRVVISGCIGPRDDGYVVGHCMTAVQAKTYHLPQIRALAEAKADMVSAFTMNYSDEALGIVQAAKAVGAPVVISFTVETDGRLPNGETLKAAIEKIDQLTENYPAYFMINCAHPRHFESVLQEKGEWKNRIGGIRANASVKSHAELDACETLDVGDKQLLAQGYSALRKLLPNVQVFGGCCGTDHTHIEAICEALFGQPVGSGGSSSNNLDHAAIAA